MPFYILVLMVAGFCAAAPPASKLSWDIDFRKEYPSGLLCDELRVFESSSPKVVIASSKKSEVEGRHRETGRIYRIEVPMKALRSTGTLNVACVQGEKESVVASSERFDFRESGKAIQGENMEEDLSFVNEDETGGNEADEDGAERDFFREDKGGKEAFDKEMLDDKEAEEVEESIESGNPASGTVFKYLDVASIKDVTPLSLYLEELKTPCITAPSNQKPVKVKRFRVVKASTSCPFRAPELQSLCKDTEWVSFIKGAILESLLKLGSGEWTEASNSNLSQDFNPSVHVLTTSKVTRLPARLPTPNSALDYDYEYQINALHLQRLELELTSIQAVRIKSSRLNTAALKRLILSSSLTLVQIFRLHFGPYANPKDFFLQRFPGITSMFDLTVCSAPATAVTAGMLIKSLLNLSGHAILQKGEKRVEREVIEEMERVRKMMKQ